MRLVQPGLPVGAALAGAAVASSPFLPLGGPVTLQTRVQPALALGAAFARAAVARGAMPFLPTGVAGLLVTLKTRKKVPA